MLHNGDFSKLCTNGKEYEGDESLVDWKTAFSIFFHKLENQRIHAKTCKTTTTEACYQKVQEKLETHKEFFFQRREFIPPLTLRYLDQVFFNVPREDEAFEERDLDSQLGVEHSSNDGGDGPNFTTFSWLFLRESDQRLEPVSISPIPV
jgi:hypothetical protein